MSPKRDGELDSRVWDEVRRDVEDEFGRYGGVRQVWIARKPPGFGKRGGLCRTFGPPGTWKWDEWFVEAIRTG